MKPTVIDLFCGAGGLSEGFSQAGFEILAANEIREDAVATYKINHKNTAVFLGDIKKISPEKFREQCGLNNKKINVIIGGPPCQGFSTANRQRLVNDSRNSLYKYFLNFIKEFIPDIFVMENVKGMKNKIEEILEDFRNIGYFAEYKILDARDYGIPQHRERLFIIGTNLGKNESINLEIIKKIFSGIEASRFPKIIPLHDALWGLRKLTQPPERNMTGLETEKHGLTEDKIIKSEGNPPEYILRINKGKIPEKVYNHKARYNNDRDREIFRKLPQGAKSDHPSIKEIMPYKSRSHIFKDKFYKLLANAPAKTITAHMKYDCHMYIHPFEARGLTPREAARIQGFPDDYKFIGPFTKWYMQIGDAVPPLLAKIIAKNILMAVPFYN